MKSFDNSTPHLSSVYDEQVRKTIPYYDNFHDETIKLVKAVRTEPKLWLDTGCGTGSLVIKALEVFSDTRFVLSDPSNEMLEEARKKLTPEKLKRVEFLENTSTLDIQNGVFEAPDIITAIQAHHYLSKEGRKAATQNCFRLLEQDGVYITFENIRPLTEKGIEIGKKRWTQFQISMGKDAVSAGNHMNRFDSEYFPVTIEEHLALLRECGFRCVEVLWYSCMQAGFYGIK